MKANNVQAAVETYERAVNRYAESGFPNNAIALCNKILRNAPGRTHIYLKLAKLMVERGFVAEAKQNLLEYAERMQRDGQVEQAFDALKEFADLSPDNEEIRLLLAEQLKAAARTDEAREQLAKLYAEVEETGDARRARTTLQKMKAIDPDYDVAAAPKPKKVDEKKAKTGELVFLDLDEKPEEAVPVAEETAEVAPSSVDIDIERASAEYLSVAGEPVETVSGLDVEAAFEAPAEGEVEALEIEPTAIDESSEAPSEGAVAEAPPEEAVPEVGEVAEAEEAAPEEEELPLIMPEDVLVAPEVTASAGVVEELAVEDLEIEEPVLAAEELPAAVAEEPPAVVVEEPPAEPVEEVVEELPAAVAEEPPAVVVEEPPAELVEELVQEAPVVEPEVAEEPVEVEAAAELVPVAEEEEPASFELDVRASGEMEVPELDLAGFGAEEEAATGVEEAAAEVTATAPPEAGAAMEPEAPEEPAVEGAPGVVEATAVAVEAPPVEVGPPDVATLEGQIADDPDDPVLHRTLGEVLVEQGERDRGIEELGISLSLYESKEDWRHAENIADEILRIEPNSVHHHQKRVEFAFRKGDKVRLAGAYLGLADALLRGGSAERARAVYLRVLEHDPENEQARLCLATLEPPPEEPAAATAAPAPATPTPTEAPVGDFVDLGALVLGDEPVARDTRMRIEEEEPTGDEQRDFEEMLSQFKKGIEANVAEEDWQAHYDLGVAFKEMGLLDEAISEFQKALRSPDGRLRTAEALGLCFFEKGQFSVAGTVLRRAVESVPGSDEEKIGLLYWLARCEEEQGKGPDALGFYQRIFAIDINFQDVSSRVKSLAQAGR